MRKLLLQFLLCASGLMAQVSFPNPVRSGASLPATCTPGGLVPAWFLLTAGGPVATPYYCSAPNTWTASGGGGASPAGCPGAGSVQLYLTAGSFGCNAGFVWTNANGGNLKIGVDVSFSDCANGVVIGPSNAFTDELLAEDCGPLVVGGGPVVAGSATWYAVGDDTGSFVHTIVRAMGTPTAPTKVLAGNNLGVWEFESYSGITNRNVGTFTVSAVNDQDAMNPISLVNESFGSFLWRVKNPGTADFDAMEISNAGKVSIDDLKTTGAATGKNTVCVDTSTGILYASSTGTDCSN